MEDANIKEKAINSIKWTTIAEVFTRLLQPLTAIILARLLSPQEFGVVGVAIIVISFSQIFWEAGLGKTIIQADKDISITATVTFWTNVILSLLIYIAIFTVAPKVGQIYGDPVLTPLILKVLGIQVVIQAFSVVQNALFQRDLNFKILFLIRIMSAFIPLLITMPLALIGMGVWALVWGSLAGTLFQSVALWLFSSWRPSITYNWIIALRAWQFSRWVILEGILAWFYNWADSVLLGVYLGTKDLGLYRTANIFIVMVFGVGINPLLSILYPMFSRIQNDRNVLVATFGKAVRLVTAVVLPVALILSLFGNQIADIVFGDKWIGLGQIISFLAIVQGWSWFQGGINSEAYKAIGRPDVNPKLMAIALIYYLPIYFFSLSKGFELFLWARLLVCVGTFPLHIWFLTKTLKLSPFFLWDRSKITWLSVAVTGIVILIVQNFMVFHPVHMIGKLMVLSMLLGISLITYVGTTAIVDLKFAKEVVSLSRRALTL
jgi:O-antigen/teichoic acid export membrane protein